MATFDELKTRRRARLQPLRTASGSGSNLASGSGAGGADKQLQLQPASRVLDLNDRATRLQSRVAVHSADGESFERSKGKAKARINLPDSMSGLAQLNSSSSSSPLAQNIEAYSKDFPPHHPFVQLKVHDESEDSRRGRGVFAKGRYICPATTILSLTPHVAVLDTPCLSNRCSGCFLDNDDFDQELDEDDKDRVIRKCTRCNTVAYCGVKCQKLDWTAHKPECTALISFRQRAIQLEKEPLPLPPSGLKKTKIDVRGVAKVPSSPVRALARLLWKKQRQNATWWRALQDLECHINLCDQPQKEKLMQLALALGRFIDNNVLRDTIGWSRQLLVFCSQFTDNSFALTSPTLDNIGVVICPAAAMINHSCEPNAVIVFPEGGPGAERAEKDWLRVVAIKRIAPGEEILASYVDIAETVFERRDGLAKGYFFSCDCEGCEQTLQHDYLDPREAIKCPECKTWFQGPIKGNDDSEPNSRSGSPEYDDEDDEEEDEEDDDIFSLTSNQSLPSGDSTREISCPSCGFSREINIEAHRLAIKRYRPYVNASLDAYKTGMWSEKAMGWIKNCLLPFTYGNGFYPILELRRLSLTSDLITQDPTKLSLACAKIDDVLDGVRQIYHVGHPILAVTQSMVAKLLTWHQRELISHKMIPSTNIVVTATNNTISTLTTTSLTKSSSNNLKLGNSTSNGSSSSSSSVCNGNGSGSGCNLMKEDLDLLISLRNMSGLASELCKFGFGQRCSGGRLGRQMTKLRRNLDDDVRMVEQILGVAHNEFVA